MWIVIKKLPSSEIMAIQAASRKLSRLEKICTRQMISTPMRSEISGDSR